MNEQEQEIFEKEQSEREKQGQLAANQSRARSNAEDIERAERHNQEERRREDEMRLAENHRADNRRHEDEKRLEESRKEDQRRKEENKKHRHFKGNDIGTLAIDDAVGLVKAIGSDTAYIANQIKIMHEEKVSARANVPQIAEARQADRPATIPKESPAMERYKAHAQALSGKAQERIRSQGKSQSHSIGRER